MGNAHIQERLLLFQNISLSSCSSFYITVQALMVLSLSLMWHLKDCGIFRRPQSSDFGGYLAESQAVIENNCCLQAVVNASYGAALNTHPILDYAFS